MKTPNEVKQNFKEKAEQISKAQKVSSCCGPTCCGGSNEKTNSGRKEK
jgi:hypothetical protein